MCGRRKFIKGLSAFSIATSFSSKASVAQNFRVLCSYAGGSFGSGLAPASNSAIAAVRDIENVLGYYANLDVYRGGVPNAAAMVWNSRYAIVYNHSFMSGLASCHRIAPYTVLAHEVGHHANADTQWAGQFRNSWSKEFGADFVSGVAMRRLGIDLDAAQSAILCTFGAFSPGNSSHPGSQQRLAAIADGWWQG